MAELSGTSWGNTPTTLGDAGGLVTWSIAPGGLDTGVFPSGPGRSVDPNSFLSIDYADIINDAFGEWSEHGNIEFMQIADQGGAAGSGNVADIRIFFGPIPGGAIGYAFFPTSAPHAGAGDILLDNLSSFNTNPDLLFDLALHEIGHALGLEHVPQSTNSVMTPTLSHDHLQADDIRGIQQIYGPQDHRPTVYNMAAGENTLTILNSPDRLVVNGNAASNRITGADQSEIFNGGDGFDTIFAGAGNDRLDGGAKSDRLFGGAGNDAITGGAGADIMYGEAGNDTMNSGDDADRLYGGSGNDLLRAGWAFGTTVDGLWGDSGNDTLLGESGYDMLDGGTGNDLLDGGTQADNLYGQAGNDTLRGGQGHDRLFAGDGNDFARGGTENDGLFGGTGNDTLAGESGNDRMFGEVGEDRLDGGAGNDTLYGGASNDTLIGGTGNDVLLGNFNADTFVFADGHGRDTITDFHATNDLEKIDLSKVSAIVNMSDLVNNHMSQVGVNVVIDTGGGNSITLNSTNIADLDSADFIF